MRLAIDPDLDGVTGRFYDRQRRGRRAIRRPTTREARRRLWELSLALTGEREPFV